VILINNAYRSKQRQKDGSHAEDIAKSVLVVVVGGKVLSNQPFSYVLRARLFSSADCDYKQQYE
jgi:hypothetical protein